MENPHLYSAYDLQKTRGKSLPELLNKALTFATHHVTTCVLCSSKGHVCEVCNKNEVIRVLDSSIYRQYTAIMLIRMFPNLFKFRSTA